MAEDPTRGTPADQSGWVTTKVAAQALRVDPRTVRKYINQGKLEAKVEGEGVEKAYLVSIDSVYALRGRAADRTRTGPGGVRESGPREAAGSAVTEDLVALVRDLTSEVSRHSSEAAELRTRLELTEQAESSRREALEQRIETERVLREQTEQERDRLLAELEGLRDRLKVRAESESLAGEAVDGEGAEDPYLTHAPPTPEHPESHGHTLYGTSAQEAEESLHRRSSWWRRFFGFE
jgi:hypothetical protein